jgi:hypothetical protein
MNKRVRKIAGMVAMALVGIPLFAVAVMLLWNALMPDIFHLPVVNFWQALGLLVLSKLLFTGFRGGRGGGWRKGAVRERWANMTPEQREKFKQEWGHRCGKPFPAGDQGGAGQQS